MFVVSDLMKKRLRNFKKIRRSYVSLIVLSILLLISLFAEVIANNKPLLIIFEGKAYFPFIKVYKEKEFYGDEILEPDYRNLIVKIKDNSFIIKPPVFWGYNESNVTVSLYPSPPTKDNLLGTDSQGRDILTRLIYGVRVSMAFALMNYLFSIFFGVLVGGLQGFFGKWVDLLGQRLVEIWGSVPYFFLLILLGSIFEPGFFVLVLMSSIFSWITLSYYFRAETLKVKSEEFVLASRSLGAGPFSIFFTHVLPNALTPLVTMTPFIIANGVLLLSFLDFLGFGVEAPTASIGELLMQGQSNLETAWWLSVFPFLTLVSILMLLNFIGEGVRAAFDPRK